MCCSTFHIQPRKGFQPRGHRASRSHWNQDRPSRSFSPLVDNDPACGLSFQDISPDTFHPVGEVGPMRPAVFWSGWNKFGDDSFVPGNDYHFTIFDPSKNPGEIVLYFSD